MSESTDLVRDLIAANVPADLVARVAVLAARIVELDRRRAADANRQRAARQRHVTSRESRDTADVTPPHIYTSPLSKNSKPSVSRSMRASSIPADWAVSAAGRAYARQKRGWDDAHIDREAERFQDHALSNGRKQVDWEASWRKWVMSHYQDKQQENNGKSLLAVIDKHIDRAAAAAYVPGSAGPKPVGLDRTDGPQRVRLISTR